MNTIPPLSLNGHLDNLMACLLRFFPNLDKQELVFYDLNSCWRLETGKYMKKEDLIPYEKFAILFENLCSEGREWINISGDSWYGKKFLVSIDYSRKTGFPATYILIGGPSFDSMDNLLKQTKLKVV